MRRKAQNFPTQFCPPENLLVNFSPVVTVYNGANTFINLKIKL